MRAIVVLAAVALGGCGASDDASFTDGNPGSDAGNSDAASCVVAVQFTPAAPVAPQVIVAEANVLDGTGVFGFHWTVQRGGADVPFEPLDLMGRDIQFTATLPGVYRIGVFTEGGCTSFANDLNVGTSGANQRPVRMRFVPPPGTSVPPQERVVTVPGGSDYSLGTVVLDPGVLTPVSVRTSAGAPVSGYLRFTSRSTPDAAVEAWSAGGATMVRLAAGHQDVFVVPMTALAPALISDWDPASGVISIGPGASWTGTVIDSGGAPIAGARVSLTSAGLPSTVATTDGAGHFDVGWRDGAGAEQVTVVPPPGRGLPRLDVSLAIPAASTTIRFAAVATRALGGVEVLVGGAPAADADVSLVLTVPAAGSVESPSAPTVAAGGGQRLLLHTGADGRLPAVTAIAAVGDVFVTAGGGARGAIDLTAGVGATLAAAPAVAVSARVVDSVGAAVAGARLRVELDDALAYAGAPVINTTSDANGNVALALAPGQRYAITVVDPSARRASLRANVMRNGAGALAPFTLGKAIRVSGEVRATGVGAPLRAVGVAALCQLGCDGLDRDRPLGEAVTDQAGRFTVAVPDPGVMQ